MKSSLSMNIQLIYIFLATQKGLPTIATTNYLSHQVEVVVHLYILH